MNEIAGLKMRLRGECRLRRDALPAADRAAASLAVATHAEDDLARRLDAAAPGAVVGGTLPIGSELDPRPLMRRLAARGLRLALPAIAGGELEFREWDDDAALEPQGFGTLAPGPQAARLRPALLLVPLLAFDEHGGRLGYGGGFYDRALARFHLDGGAPVHAVGLAFAAQEVAAVPLEPHDRRLDLVVTESGVRVPSDKGWSP